MIISFLTGWFKITGFAIPFLMAGFMFIKQERKTGWKLVLVGVLSVLSYLAYGILADKQSFSVYSF